jgi:hypothetical protein
MVSRHVNQMSSKLLEVKYEVQRNIRSLNYEASNNYSLHEGGQQQMQPL